MGPSDASSECLHLKHQILKNIASWGRYTRVHPLAMSSFITGTYIVSPYILRTYVSQINCGALNKDVNLPEFLWEGGEKKGAILFPPQLSHRS